VKVQDVLVSAAAVFAALVGFSTDERPARTFSVPLAKAEFEAETGLRLVNFRAASTPEVTSLRTKPYQTPRFGNFQLFVLRPGKVQRMRRVFTSGVEPDSQGIHWVPDRMGGWIAVTLYDRNLVLAWFPQYRSRSTDMSWVRLTRAVMRLAPPGRLEPHA
jgi:hypothetical protein